MHWLWVYLAFTAISNYLLMRRPRGAASGIKSAKYAVLIPARDEEENLQILLPLIVSQVEKVYVYDDDSSDKTAEIAAQLGATVIRASQPLPEGWTGKNWACHQLAQSAAEDSPADWWIFLDADTRPSPGFIACLEALNARTPVVTAFPTLAPGRGLQPMFLFWVAYSLLASNWFGVVARTRKAHNMFLNGQFTAWKATTYTALWPNEAVKGSVLEDVQMGRFLARNKVPVEVANLSHCLTVKMYETASETVDGMSKNSFEITGRYFTNALLALLMLVIAWGWVLSPIAAVCFWLSCLAVCLTVRASLIWLPFAPFGLTIGAYTIIRSCVWKARGKRIWKGRTY